MASDQAPNGQNGTALNNAMAGLSLASRGVHADDNIAVHRAVAPAMHVSTTFRYSDDPDLLKPSEYTDVSFSSPITWAF